MSIAKIQSATLTARGASEIRIRARLQACRKCAVINAPSGAASEFEFHHRLLTKDVFLRHFRSRTSQDPRCKAGLCVALIAQVSESSCTVRISTWQSREHVHLICHCPIQRLVKSCLTRPLHVGEAVGIILGSYGCWRDWQIMRSAKSSDSAIVRGRFLPETFVLKPKLFGFRTGYSP